MRRAAHPFRCGPPKFVPQIRVHETRSTVPVVACPAVESRMPNARITFIAVASSVLPAATKAR